MSVTGPHMQGNKQVCEETPSVCSMVLGVCDEVGMRGGDQTSEKTAIVQC